MAATENKDAEKKKGPDFIRQIINEDLASGKIGDPQIE